MWVQSQRHVTVPRAHDTGHVSGRRVQIGVAHAAVTHVDQHIARADRAPRKRARSGQSGGVEGVRQWGSGAEQRGEKTIRESHIRAVPG